MTELDIRGKRIDLFNIMQYVGKHWNHTGSQPSAIIATSEQHAIIRNANNPGTASYDDYYDQTYRGIPITVLPKH